VSGGIYAGEEGDSQMAAGLGPPVAGGDPKPILIPPAGAGLQLSVGLHRLGQRPGLVEDAADVGGVVVDAFRRDFLNVDHRGSPEPS
jgi:hypothetical protein